jgi:hypothetical protein
VRSSGDFDDLVALGSWLLSHMLVTRVTDTLENKKKNPQMGCYGSPNVDTLGESTPATRHLKFRFGHVDGMSHFNPGRDIMTICCLECAKRDMALKPGTIEEQGNHHRVIQSVNMLDV